MRLGFWWTNIGNFLNKILGFARTNFRLLIVGDSMTSDIFLLADKTVALFRRIFVDGNFQSIFINHYSKEQQNGYEKIFTTNVLIMMLKNLGIITLAFLIIMPFLSKILFFNPEQQNLFFKFTMFLSPLIILIFLMSFLTSVLNANEKFKISSLAPNVGNAIYVFIFYLSAKKIVNWNIGTILCLGALFYALFQVLFMGLFSSPYFGKYDKGIKHDFSNDVMKGVSVNLIIPFSEVFTGFMASKFGKGIFSHLEYGHKYIFTVFTIIAVPIATSITPSLSKSNAQNDREKFQKDASSAFILTHILCFPFVFLLYFFSEDIVFFFIKNLDSISGKTGLSKNIQIISISLYFLMQNRILNTISNAGSQLKLTLTAAVLYGVTTIVCAVVFPLFMDYGFAWAGNAAYLVQFLYLIIMNLKRANIKFSTFNYIRMALSSFISFFLVMSGKYIFNFINLYNMSTLGIFKNLIFCVPIVLCYILYLLIFWKEVRILLIKTD